MQIEENATLLVNEPQMMDRIQPHYFLIVDSLGQVQEIDLDSMGKDRIYFGRDPDQNDIVISKEVVSRLHGKLKISQGQVHFADLGSRNGTYIESRGQSVLVKKSQNYVVLSDGDILRIQGGADHREESVLLLYSRGTQNGKWQRYLLGDKQVHIGRGKDNEIALSHPCVSRHHAVLEKAGSSYCISDTGSKHGILVNGQQVFGSCLLQERDVIQILDSILVYTNGQLLYKNSRQGVRLTVRNMNKFVDKGRQILHEVDCDIESNEFVAIIGGSGAGKTTLMNAISGFDRKKEGEVFFNGISMEKNFPMLKNLIGYVPQQDIIYENLTLKRMLYYTAKMKMPKDTSKQEIEQRIQEALGMVELLEHQNTYIRKLSGGQKKRASIAVELLADPSLFFLDEPTSGLDPGTEKKLMQTLGNLAKSQGKTIIMVTHTTQSLDLCDKVIFMGQGGRLCFCGTTQEARMFFGMDSLVDIYNEITARSPIWEEQYKNCVPAQKVQAQESVVEERRKGVGGIRQMGILMCRYAELIKNDIQRLGMLLLQPVAIALLLAVVADDKVFEIYESTKSILFALCCAGMWIGLFNSIQEICKERVILKREYMSNLRLWAYMLSKYMVQAVLGVIQALLITTVFALAVGMPEKGLLFPDAFFDVFFTLWLTIMASMALGLVISAMVKTGDKAMTCAPFVLIIQLLFSGILFELKGAGETIAYVTVSKWSVESLGSIANLNELETKMQQEMPNAEHEFQEIFEFTTGHLLSNWAILAGMAVFCGILATVLLRRVSRDDR